MSETIERSLGRIEGTLNSVKESQSRLEALLSSHSTRLARMEQRERYQLGLVVGGGAVASGVFTLVFHVWQMMKH